MDVKTARKYLAVRKLPSEQKAERTWRTRPDPFQRVWEEVRQQIDSNPGLEAKTLFEALQRQHPGEFADGQLRTLQRHIKRWRATEGPGREVFFAQKHVPGRLGQSDFTYMNELGITIGRQSFPHMLYHFVLTYSNWEDVTLCHSGSFESLSEGLQNALWELGGVPQEHRTDRLSTAVNNMSNEKEFTARYDAQMICRAALRDYPAERAFDERLLLVEEEIQAQPQLEVFSRCLDAFQRLCEQRRFKQARQLLSPYQCFARTRSKAKALLADLAESEGQYDAQLRWLEDEARGLADAHRYSEAVALLSPAAKEFPEVDTLARLLEETRKRLGEQSHLGKLAAVKREIQVLIAEQRYDEALAEVDRNLRKGPEDKSLLDLRALAAGKIEERAVVCLASTIPPGQRQLFLPIGDNYKLCVAVLLPYTGAGRSRG